MAFNKSIMMDGVGCSRRTFSAEPHHELSVAEGPTEHVLNIVLSAGYTSPWTLFSPPPIPPLSPHTSATEIRPIGSCHGQTHRYNEAGGRYAASKFDNPVGTREQNRGAPLAGLIHHCRDSCVDNHIHQAPKTPLPDSLPVWLICTFFHRSVPFS